MDTKQVRRAARLAQIDAHLAEERRHVSTLTARLETARARGWPPRQSEDLLDLAEKRIALLSQQRADLVIAMGGEPAQNSN
jgi:hypothetical protein